LGVSIDDDPKRVALGARKFEQLEVPAVHRIEIAGSDGDEHEETNGLSGWRLADGTMQTVSED
jgi:hypothetical protein